MLILTTGEQLIVTRSGAVVTTAPTVFAQLIVRGNTALSMGNGLGQLTEESLAMGGDATSPWPREIANLLIFNADSISHQFTVSTSRNSVNTTRYQVTVAAGAGFNLDPVDELWLTPGQSLWLQAAASPSTPLTVQASYRDARPATDATAQYSVAAQLADTTLTLLIAAPTAGLIRRVGAIELHNGNDAAGTVTLLLQQGDATPVPLWREAAPGHGTSSLLALTPADIHAQTAITFPGDATKFLNGTGAFTTPGADSNTILSGTAVPTTEGVNGDYYLKTDTSRFYGPKTSGGWGAGVSLIGPAGTNGTNGSDGSNGTNGTDGLTILNGTAVPTAEGVIGDYYFKTDTSRLYGPKTGDGWGSGVSLIGPAGNDGTNGTNGTDGFGTLSMYDALLDNLTLLQLRAEVQNSLTVQNMRNGIVDGLMDETGIDTTDSQNLIFSTGKASNTGADQHIATLLHFDDTVVANAGPTGVFTAGGGTPVIDTANKVFGAGSMLGGYLVADAGLWDFGHNSFTLEGWFKFGSNIDTQVMFLLDNRGDTSGNGMYWLTFGHVLHFGTGNTGTLPGSDILTFDLSTLSPALDLSVFHHIAVTRDSTTNTFSLYLDGTRVANATANVTFNYTGVSGTGIGNNGGGDYLINIDEWAVSLGICRYSGDAYTIPTKPYGAPRDMTLITNPAANCQASPDTIRLLGFAELGGGALNTDLTGKVSRDNGSTWVAATLVDLGAYVGTRHLLACEVTFTDQPAGTAPAAKFVTTDGYTINLYGYGLAWS